MFGFLKKKKEKNYFCEKCGEYFSDEHLKAKNYTRLKCPFCGSIECYEIHGKTLKKNTK